jgi:hypothetical protein
MARDNSNRTVLNVSEPDYTARGLDPGQGPVINSVAPVPEPAPAKALSDEQRHKIDVSTRGASGTANFQGFIRHTGEYLDKFMGWHSMHVYEEMRRSDPTVQALNYAQALPIRAAHWDVVPAEATDVRSQAGGNGKVASNGAGKATAAKAKEVADLVKENLFGGMESPTRMGGWSSQTFESALEHANLANVFGCAAHEQLWHSDADKNRVHLRQLFPLMPRTYYRFLVEPDGNTLEYLVQYGFRGPRYIVDQIPASKIDLFVVNREGGNWYGRSPLRAAYKPWWFKQNFLAIFGLQAQRNAVGIPWLEQGPNASPEDVAKSWQWGQWLAANERTNLTTPPGWKFNLVCPSGRPLDLTEGLQYFDEQILDAGLAGFIALGKSETGARNVGDVKLQFFLLSEQATARMLCDTMNQGSIRNLVDYNFRSSASDEIPYPKLTCSDIVMLDPMDLVTAVKELGNFNVDWLHASDERDAFMAKKFGLPQLAANAADRRVLFGPVNQRVVTNEPDTETPEQVETDKSPGSPTDVQKGGTPAPKPGVSKTLGEGQAHAAQVQQRMIGAGFKDAPRKAWRPKRPFEQHFDYDAHRQREDVASTQVARALRRARPDVIAAVAHQAARQPVTNLGAVAAPFDHDLSGRVQKILERAAKFGRGQVHEEYRKQVGAGASRRPARTGAAAMAGVPRGGDAASKAAQRGYDARLFAQAAVTDLNNWANARAAGAAVDLNKDGLEGQDLQEGISDALLASSDGFIDRIAAEAGRAAVFGGRMQGMEDLEDNIVRIVRREVMDDHTCAPCAEGDGDEWDSWDDVDWVRGDDCEGGDACRGDAIPEFKTGLVAA